MALKIKLARIGATHNAVYRVVVAEATSPRDGRFVEILGTYSPKAKKESDILNVDVERAEYWISVGAKPTDTSASLLRKAKREATAEAPAAS